MPRPVRGRPVYLYHYKDLQVTSGLNSGNTKLENAAKAVIYGIELSASVLIITGRGRAAAHRMQLCGALAG